MSPKRQSLWKRLRKLQKRLQSEKSFVKIKVLMIEINKIQQSLLDDSENTEREEERKATENIKQNTKAFYSFARRKQRAKSKVGPFKDKDGQINPDPTHTVNTLLHQYESVFSTPILNKIVENPSDFFNQVNDDIPSLKDLEFSSEDLIEATKEMAADSAPGLDGNKEILSKTRKTFCVIVTKLFSNFYVSVITPMLCIMFKNHPDIFLKSLN